MWTCQFFCFLAASVPVPSNGKCEANVSSNSSLFTESSSSGKEKEVNGVDLLRKSEAFKQFDVVGDYSDHHYGNVRIQGQEPSKVWTKKIQEEWKILEKDLPDTIFVRVYESRMDLLRAVIIGPQGTPYHDGLFVFHIMFPPTYPDVPPMVYYYSGGLQLNPNLYDCGKVCLSLLNTWTGRDNEKWLPKSSTMLQVVVSIQALILNAKPFFNESGYDTRYIGQEGERKSNSYNEDVFILSLKTMMYTLRRPPKISCPVIFVPMPMLFYQHVEHTWMVLLLVSRSTEASQMGLQLRIWDRQILRKRLEEC
ncbi:probable ubiquitin-conjugating enzyme E2 25 isoform X2 [Primulina huaijiensis]|uniref:probable ubiquitin-conjugating enzyme E2 25 isoform X2 n=1 Tax=Primulina huaijiensis TaxID=1492673 RepID=UPI003CC73FBE